MPAPDAARDQAREILSEDRFSEPSFPTPFKGFFEWLAEMIQPVLDAVGDLFAELARALPGGQPLLVGLLAVMALAAVAALLSREVRRREAVAPARGSAREAKPRADPRELERLAATAEQGGDHREAVRLRFRAGLLRLDGKGAIHLRASLTTGEVARRLRSPPFERLATDFDEIVYGGRKAEPADVEVARSEWPHVIEGAGQG